METEFEKTVDDLRNHILYMKECGIKGVTVDSGKLTVAGDAGDTPSAPECHLESGGTLEDINARIAVCEACPLSKTRNRTVPGQGCLNPDVMFIGEAPGRDEDLQGIPFVGRAGNLLTRLITRMGYTRDEVFIGNIAKCRPTVDYEMTRDRAPTSEEMNACIHFLKEQIKVIRPKVIITLGNVAMDGLFGFTGITKRRGKWLEYEGIPTMPTYHPSYLLRGGGDQGKRYWEVWEDILLVFDKLGKQPPS
jgi:DNA polymerase